MVAGRSGENRRDAKEHAVRAREQGAHRTATPLSDVAGEKAVVVASAMTSEPNMDSVRGDQVLVRERISALAGSG